MQPLKNNSQYLACPSGQVFSVNNGKYLKGTPTSAGYPTVKLRDDNGVLKTHLVHRLIAETYLGDLTGKEVNHINGVKHDNRLVNLEVVTPSQNIRHAFKTGLSKANNTICFDVLNQIVIILKTDPTATWASVANDFGYADSSGLRKLVKREYTREGKATEFTQLCADVALKSKEVARTKKLGKLPPNTKQVLHEGTVYPSLKAACADLGLQPSKACIAIKNGKAIKGKILTYV